MGTYEIRVIRVADKKDISSVNVVSHKNNSRDVLNAIKLRLRGMSSI